MKLIDADTLMLNLDRAFGDGLINSIEDLYSLIDNEPSAEAIPIEWMRARYPVNAKYSGDAYMSKAKVVRDVIREYENYIFDKTFPQVMKEILGERR